MKFNGNGSTRIGNPPDPVRFRAQCTGIGQTIQGSEQTGMRRSQRVIDCAPPEQRKLAVGYPSTTEEQMAAIGVSMAPRQTTLRRG